MPESALTPVDISVDNGGEAGAVPVEAGAVPVDAFGDTAAGAVASYFQVIRGRNLLVKVMVAWCGCSAPELLDFDQVAL